MLRGGEVTTLPRQGKFQTIKNDPLRYSIERFAFRAQDGAQGTRTRHAHKTRTRGGAQEQQSDPLVTPNRPPGQLKLTSRSLQIHPLVGPN